MTEVLAAQQPAPEAVTPKEMANAIRALSMDGVQAANSGHPGMPMGMADVATVLFTHVLKFDAANPDWPDRDRFVLSAGHGSMLLYSLLYLTGYPGMEIENLMSFRQLDSNTAGHPEFGHTIGVETTTGPLGQGLATAVGMALAERMAAARHGADIADHHTYVIAGDGCLMEGISHEAISFAGHLGLSKLIVLFDDNGISIDGSTDLSVSDDQLKRFEAAGWDATRVDGHDQDGVRAAIERARVSDKPSLIACKTVIGFGSPNKQGTAATHGAPLGEDEIALTREAIGWSYPPFEVPDHILGAWRAAGSRGRAAFKAWNERAAGLSPSERTRLHDPIDEDARRAIIEAVGEAKAGFVAEGAKLATRVSSQKVLERLVPVVPGITGGSADLTGSNGTKTSHYKPITPRDFSGNYIHYGVREHAMAAAMNGMALHGGFVPYGATFLVFTDYCRPAIRLSALMEQRVVYVMTHDSIGLGEDGPTHQPVEHLASLRAMPNVNVFRPADAVECAECWQAALLNSRTPSILSLTRQGLALARTDAIGDNLSAKGAYVLRETDGPRDVTLLATGSEVGLAIEAAAALAGDGIKAAVVSMPCWELFEAQSESYRADVLGSAPRIAIEAACRFGWDRWIGDRGHFIGMASFGASAPADQLYEKFGITSQAITAAAKRLAAG